MSARREVRFIGSDGFILTIGTLPDDGLLRVETTVGTLTHVHLIDAIEFVTGEPAPAREEPREADLPGKPWRAALLELAEQASRAAARAGTAENAARDAIVGSWHTSRRDAIRDAKRAAGEAAERAYALQLELLRLAGKDSGS